MSAATPRRSSARRSRPAGLPTLKSRLDASGFVPGMPEEGIPRLARLHRRRGGDAAHGLGQHDRQSRPPKLTIEPGRVLLPHLLAWIRSAPLASSVGATRKLDRRLPSSADLVIVGIDHDAAAGPVDEDHGVGRHMENAGPQVEHERQL